MSQSEAIAALRETTKWTAAALAGIATVTTAGLPLASATRPANLGWLRIAVASVAAAVALAAAWFVIAAATRVLTYRFTNLHQLLELENRTISRAATLADGETVLPAYLFNAVTDALKRSWGVICQSDATDVRSLNDLLDSLDDADDRRSLALADGARILDFANTVASERSFKRYKRVAALSASAVVAAIGVFAWATGTPDKRGDDAASIGHPTPVWVVLTPAGHTLLASDLGTRCPIVLRGVAIDGELPRPTIEIVPTPQCHPVPHLVKLTQKLGIAIPMVSTTP